MHFDSSSDSESEISDSSSESDCDLVAYDSADEADCDMFLLVGTIVMFAHLEQDNFHISVPRDQIIPVQRLNLMAMSDFDARRHFRLTAFQLPALAVAFGLQGPMKTNARDRFLGLEGLCLVLRRLVFPSRWTDLTPLFGRSQTSLCRIFWCCANHIYTVPTFTGVQPPLFSTPIARVRPSCVCCLRIRVAYHWFYRWIPPKDLYAVSGRCQNFHLASHITYFNAQLAMDTRSISLSLLSLSSLLLSQPPSLRRSIFHAFSLLTSSIPPLQAPRAQIPFDHNPVRFACRRVRSSGGEETRRCDWSGTMGFQSRCGCLLPFLATCTPFTVTLPTRSSRTS
jgi:hypothetical protein